MCKRSNYTQNSPQYEGDCEYRITSIKSLYQMFRQVCFWVPWVPEVSRCRRAGTEITGGGELVARRSRGEKPLGTNVVDLTSMQRWLTVGVRFSALNKFAGLDKFRGAVPNRSSVFFVHPPLRPRVYQAWNSKRMSSWACVLWFRCSFVLELSVQFVSSLLWLKKCSRLWCFPMNLYYICFLSCFVSVVCLGLVIPAPFAMPSECEVKFW